MKRLAYIFTLACLTILSACSSSDDKGGGGGGGGGGKTYSVNITSGSSSIVSSDGGTVSITFTTNDKWTASCSGAWCSLSATSGASGSNTLTVEVQPNDSYDERNTGVTITCGSKNAKATITQKQLDAILLSSDKLEVDYNGGAAEISVQSNISYTWSVTSGSEWIKEGTPTKGLKSSTIYLDIEDNWEQSVRQGEITITGGGKTEKVDVYQQASTPRIVISNPEVIVGSDAQDFSVELKSNCDYEVQMPEVTWVTQKVTKAASTYTLEFSVEENTTYDNRTTEIKIINNETFAAETISVLQSQKNAIIIAKTEYEISPKGETISFNVNTNVDFETSIDVNWITEVSSTKGLEEVPVSFKVDAHEGYDNRVGHITVSHDDIEQVITITQLKNSAIIVSQKKYDITSDAQKITITLQTNCDYEVQMPKVDWITEEKTKGMAEYSHVYNISANTEYDSRSAIIVFTIQGTEIRDTATINQAQKDAIIIGTTSYEVGAKATNLDINVSTNVDIETAIDVNWINKIETKALTEKTLSFAIDLNPTTEQRVGHITVSSGSIEQVVTVTQSENNDVSIVKITHKETQFTVPEIGDIISGTIDWGDGSTEEAYTTGAKHTYEDDSEKTVIIQWLGGSYISIPKLGTISEIESQYSTEE